LRQRQIQLCAVAVLCIVLMTIAFARLERHSLDLSLDQSTIPADGGSTALLEIPGSNRDLSSLTVSSSDPARLRVESIEPRERGLAVKLRAGVLPGEVLVRATERSGATRSVKVTLSPSAADYYGDGTPDFLRLGEPSDADSFRRWFAFLAETQYFNQPRLAADVSDCASLLRFAYREALRSHDSKWAATVSLPRLPSIPELQQYHYPHTPLGASLFRTRAGAFVADDLSDGAFAEFADAKTLRQFNMYFVSRRVSDARTGDILFFRQDSQSSPFHTMVYLERSALDGTAEPLAVYHTGSTDSGPGEVRRPTLQQLFQFTDARWRPLPENRAFLGVYRWNILRGSN
jgi:uncharacterized protein